MMIGRDTFHLFFFYFLTTIIRPTSLGGQAMSITAATQAIKDFGEGKASNPYLPGTEEYRSYNRMFASKMQEYEGKGTGELYTTDRNRSDIPSY